MTVPRTDEPLALKVALSFKLAILSTWSSNLDMLVFEERGKLQGYPEKKNRQEKQQKNSTHKVRRARNSNPCHNGWSWCSHQLQRKSFQSHCHVTNFLGGSQQTAFLQIWQTKTKKKNDMHNFPVHDCTQA